MKYMTNDYVRGRGCEGMSPGLPEPQGDRGEAQGQRQEAVLPHLAVPDPRQEICPVLRNRERCCEAYCRAKSIS